MRIPNTETGEFLAGNPATGTPGSMLTSEYMNSQLRELKNILAFAGVTPDPNDDRQIIKAIQSLVTDALSNRPRVFSILNLPTKDVGPIIVSECAEVWVWSESAVFTGYRSPLCGRPLDGHTLVPLINEIDAVGGLLSKVVYARLWGYAQENSLVVSPSVWAANVGAHYFADVDATSFRAPDLRNRLRRYSGTDADTAAVRALGTAQRDALQQITANAGFRPIGSGGGAGTGGGVGGAFGYTIRTGAAGASEISLGVNQYNADGLTFDASRVARTSSETRPMNTAYHPRIHA
ncbi:phage tail protein [Achromobacter insolitus]|uniref:phage tail protein n=1 Tax=Achromobacter insolitus TaxID=217204 RepID=UPI0028AD3F53|nr:phage tail protein [Achromobacter insolitus]